MMQTLQELIDRFIDYKSYLPSKTVKDQAFIQKNVLELYKNNLEKSKKPGIHYAEHAKFIESMWRNLPNKFVQFTSSQPWFCFYVLHSFQILNISLEDEFYQRFLDIISDCKVLNGGFGGGSNQEAHLGCTYAAVCCILIVGTRFKSAFNLISRDSILQFIRSCKNNDGSFRISALHETDLRATYLAIALCKLLKLDYRDLFNKTVGYIKMCQNYDGGFGSLPGLESHSGYAYCGFASLVMLESEDAIDRDRLLNWVVHRQMEFEGGFQGRCNKLVDSCYSFWCGSLIPIIQAHSNISDSGKHYKLIDRAANQCYLMLSCQISSGGFTDRLLHNPDMYHTCYSLSSLSLYQHSYFKDVIQDEFIEDENILRKIHPIYNICQETYDLCLEVFYSIKKQ